MWNFDASSFALAGLIAGAGPLLIHLLNRRRFRVVEWAAMDFLKQALERNRRILHLRDLVLLALRIAAVILFGLTLSKPFFTGALGPALGWGAISLVALSLMIGGTLMGVLSPPSRNTSSNKKVNGWSLAGLGLLLAIPLVFLMIRSLGSAGGLASQRSPVHAIVIVDNSRSMGTDDLTGTLLDRARAKAIEYVESLPPDSRFSILPMCGQAGQFTLDAYRSPQEARRALERIVVTDLVGSPASAIELSRKAAAAVSDLPSKRLVILTDLQQVNWTDASLKPAIAGWEEVQIARVTNESSPNLWVSGFQLEDGLAGIDAPSRLLARVQASGNTAAVHAQVTLTIDDEEVATQAVEIQPGQVKELEFPHQFDQMVESGRVEFSTCKLTVQSDSATVDRLARDNATTIVVPVVAALPVVFIDQYGSEENLDQKKIGETYALRHFLAPRTSRERANKQLIHIEHLRPEQVTVEHLATARLVVMAGVENPGDTVPLLRDYVRQGGSLMIFAGGNFHAGQWNERAWQAGDGLLPAPLEPEPIGVTPEEDLSRLKPFQLAYESLSPDYFQIANEDPETLRGLLESTIFFKAVRAKFDDEMLQSLRDALLKKESADREFLDHYQQFHAKNPAENVPGTAANRSGEQADWERRYRELEPKWWAWRSPMPLVERSRTPEEVVGRQMPLLLGRYSGNALPFLIQRRMGAGQVMFFTSGISSNWNLLSRSSSMFIFHRLCSGLIEETLPTRNFRAGDRIVIPWERRVDQRFSLIRPNQMREPLAWEALGSDVYGMEVRHPVEAGGYKLVSESPSGRTVIATPVSSRSNAALPVSEIAVNESSGTSSSGPKEEIALAVTASDTESDLTIINPEELTNRLGSTVRVFQPTEPIPLTGGSRRGHDLWKWLAVLVLVTLLAEMAVLASPFASSGTKIATSVPGGES